MQKDEWNIFSRDGKDGKESNSRGTDEVGTTYSSVEYSNDCRPTNYTTRNNGRIATRKIIEWGMVRRFEQGEMHTAK